MVKTPISILQEILVQQKLPLPAYSEQISDRVPFPFKCTVKVGDIIADGYAYTKKDAKQNSAQEALIKLGVGACSSYSSNSHVSKLSSKPSVNYIGLLNEHASGKQVPYPLYTENIPVNGQFKVVCQFMNLTVEGISGLNKKNAKQESARLMLERIETEDVSFEPDQRALNKMNEDYMKNLLQKYDSLHIHNDDLTASVSKIKLPKIKIEYYTIEELLDKLTNKGHTCSVDVFQRDPYIMVLRVDSCVIMGQGESKEKAMEDLVVISCEMFQKNFSFKRPFSSKLDVKKH